MRRRRPWVVSGLATVALAVGAWWLLSPVPDDAVSVATSGGGGSGGEGRLAGLPGRARRTRLDVLLAWLERQFERVSRDVETPPLAFAPAPTLGDPGSLEVEVRVEGGAPVAGARVGLYVPPGAPRRGPESTGADGFVTFRDLPSAEGYVVIVRGGADLRNPSWADARTVAVRPRETTRVVVERPALRVEGKVLDAGTKAPVAGAKVEAFVTERTEVPATGTEAFDAQRSAMWPVMRFGPPLGEAWSDAEGRFALDLGGAQVAWVRARTSDGRAGGGPASASTERGSLQLLVAPSRRFEGVVVDGDGGALAGVRVTVLGGEGLRAEPPVAVTGSDGRFHVASPDTRPSLSVLLEGDAVPPFSARLGPGVETRIVVPDRSATLDLHVVEADTGRAVAGARILCTGAGSSTEAVAATDGRAQVPLPPGEIPTLEVAAEDRAALTLDRGQVVSGLLDPPDGLVAALKDGEVRAVTVRLPAGVVLLGRVVHADGRPARGARVVAGGSLRNGVVPAAYAGEDGAFRLEGVVPPSHGSGILVHGGLEGEGVLFSRVPLAPEDVRRGPIDVGDLVLQGDALVRLRVVDPEGKPVTGAWVSRGGGGATRLEGGVLVLELLGPNLGPDAVLDFDLEARGFRTRELRVPASLAPGDVRDVGTIRMERASALDVRVLDAGGRPLAGVRVAWGGVYRNHDPVATDAEGRASLPGLAGEDEEVVVTLPGEATFRRRGDLSADGPLELRVPPLRAVEVRVTDRAGVPVGSASASIASGGPDGCLRASERWGRADPGGVVRLDDVAAVPATVTVHAPGFVTERRDVEASGTSVAVVLTPIGDESNARLRDVLAELERLEAEIGSNPSDDSEAARTRARRVVTLQAERDRLLGR